MLPKRTEPRSPITAGISHRFDRKDVVIEGRYAAAGGAATRGIWVSVPLQVLTMIPKLVHVSNMGCQYSFTTRRII